MSSPNDRVRSFSRHGRGRISSTSCASRGGETWGHGQVSIYRDKIDDALQLIGRNPGMGHRSSDLSETHRVYFVGSHVVVYRDQDTCVAVVRILHQRMSLARRV